MDFLSVKVWYPDKEPKEITAKNKEEAGVIFNVIQGAIFNGEITQAEATAIDPVSKAGVDLFNAMCSDLPKLQHASDLIKKHI